MKWLKDQSESGKLVKNCNNIKDFNFADIDYDYYIKEGEIIMLLKESDFRKYLVQSNKL